jgi:hypothetical protein
MVADLHRVQELKFLAADFIKENTYTVMQTEGWQELYKNQELVQFLLQMVARK